MFSLLVLAVMGCAESGAKTRDSVLSELAKLDSAERVERPFESQRIAVGESKPLVEFDVSCSDQKQTIASLMLLGLSSGDAFVTTVNAPITTRVLSRVDAGSWVDERWEVSPVGFIAFSPMPVSFGMRLRNARTLDLAFWPYGGDSTQIRIDVSHAGERLRLVASECRWPT